MLAKRLAGLRQQAGVAARPMAAPVAPQGKTTGEQVVPPAAPRGKTTDAQVAQLRKLLGLRPRALSPVHSFDRSLEGVEIAPGLRYIEKWVPFERLPARLDLTALNLTAPALDQIETHRILAFDTETTGLAGGTGTRAFMIGASDWRDGGLRIRQLLMTTMGAEQAMLREFANWLEPRTVLLSYNGKCYDRPLLSTRYTLARLSDPVLGRDHIDLLHPVRRRYRGVWENCRLATVERQLLGVVREDDLPGSEAPAAWLDYLRGGSADKLRRVGDHNAQDLRSLAGLLVHFHAQAQLLSVPDRAEAAAFSASRSGTRIPQRSRAG
ncbi:ribonuclease H-like domain-containing protein [Luteimonas sp. A482]